MPEENVGGEISAEDQSAIAAEILGTTPKEEVKTEAEGEATPDAEDAQVAANESESSDTAVEGDGKEEDPLQVVKDYIDSKYGGDPKKFMDGLWNLQNAGSKQHKELQEVKELIENLKNQVTPKLSADPLENNQDAQRFKQQLTGIEGKFGKVIKDQDALLTEGQAIRTELATLEGELRRADDFEKSILTQKRIELTNKLERLRDRYDLLEDKKESFREKYAETEEKLARLKEQAQTQSELRQHQESLARAEGQQFLQDFNNVVDELVTSKGFSKESKTRQLFYNHLKGEAALFWQSNPNTKIDPEEFINARATAFFEGIGEVKKQSLTSKVQEKLAATTKSPKAAPKPQTTTKKEVAPKGKMTLEEARAFTRQVMGG